ncbi:MAG: gamma-glutamyltransferase, partial [Actinomycetota bacterium]|nr:gamma-glutamyltransferase [Actinomycetota bacterium]
MRLSVRLIVVLALAALLLAAPALAASPPARQPSAVGEGGSAATVDPVATRAAVGALKAGGNAVDAAVAAAAVLGVVEPYSCGVGGGGFMLIYSAKDHQVHTIDSREAAPRTMTPDSFAGLTRFEAQRVSGTSVGVPGTPRAWEKALRDYGTWPLARALTPGIDVATKGFAVDQTFFDQTDAAKAIFGDFGATSALYLDKDGTPRDVGTTVRNLAMARTYKLLGQKGATKGFYSGPVARAIVNTVTRPPLRTGSTREVRPGVMTLDDLSRYRAKDRAPTKVQYQGVDVFGMGPPSSGGTTVGEALNILTAVQARPDVGSLGAIGRERALHFYLEASRYAYADRNQYVGDPSYYPVPTAGLLDRDYAAQRASLIGERAATPPVVPAGTPPGATARGAVRADRVGSTTNMTITDRQGNVVEYTFTIEQTGGSGMVVPHYGFLLNNELTDFNLSSDGTSPRGANQLTGGKRPRSSIAPTIALQNGRPFIALGSPGGATIITTVLQTLVNRLDFGQQLPEAIASPRLSQRNAATTETEPALLADSALSGALTARGQTLALTASKPPEIGAATGVELRAGGVAQSAA